MSLTTLPGAAFVLISLTTAGLGCSNSVPDEGASPQPEVKPDTAATIVDAENGPAPAPEPEPEPTVEAAGSSAPEAAAPVGGDTKPPAGKTCKSNADCAQGEQCSGPQGCGSVWTCGPPRVCTRDLVTFCGCNGEEFKASGSCPTQPYRARGKCP